MNKKVLTIVAIVAVVLIGICAVGGYFIYKTVVDKASKATETIGDISNTVNSILTTTTQTPTVTSTSGSYACKVFTAANAETILGTNVAQGETSSDTTCTYSSSSDDYSNFEAINIYISTFSDATAAKTQYQSTIDMLYSDSGESLNISGAAAAYFSDEMQQIIVLVGNKYFQISTSTGVYKTTQEAAVAAAKLLLANL